jgi:dipeptidase D
MGCAGGVDASITLPLEREAIAESSTRFKLVLNGLRGGHSGVDIHTGRANANKLLARFLKNHTSNLNVQLVGFNGGSLRNAIPREAYAEVLVPNSQVDAFHNLISEFETLAKTELSAIEANLCFKAQAIENNSLPLSTISQNTVLSLLNACPNGVVRMSDDIQGVVETSLNMGVIETSADNIKVLCLIRSLIDSGRSDVEGTLASLASLAGAAIEFSGAYPGWKPDPESQILHTFRDVYEEIYGHKPHIMVIHAGLECGLFKEPYPEMDMISFGPTIKFPHSPDEKVNIESVGLYWQQMKAILENIPAK